MSKITIVEQSLYAPLGDAADKWTKVIQNNVKVGLEFESNLKGNPDKCTRDKEGKCDITECRFFGAGCTQAHHGQQWVTSNGKKKSCSFAFDCLDYPAACDGCADFQVDGEVKLPGPCCKANCKAFAPQCRDCREMRTENIRNFIQRELQPTGSLTYQGKNGVNQVKEDGSLHEHGVEVTTCGRRFDFDKMMSQYSNILSTMHDNGGYIDAHCGAHIHTLLAYTGKIGGGGSNGFNTELEEAVPAIIIANMHQIVRRFVAEMCWVSSALDIDGCITRYSQFRRALFQVDGSKKFTLLFSPVKRHINDVAKAIEANANKYGLTNYKYCSWDENKDALAAHIEFRFPDMHFVPEVHVAMAGLLCAIWLKASKISEFGVMSAGTSKWCEEELNLYKAICNMGQQLDDDGNIVNEDPATKRLSTPPSKKEIGILIDRSHLLVDFLRQELMSLDDGDDRLCKILHSLADSPLCNRKGSPKELSKQFDTNKSRSLNRPFSQQEKAIIKIITLGEVVANNESSWKKEVEEMLQKAMPIEIDEALEKLSEKVHLMFDDRAGSYIMIDRK